MRVIAVVVLVGIAASVARSAPDSENAAERQFREGRDLMKAGQYAEACTKFADSDKLDPQAGTRFNIGLCSEKLGKLATASRVFEVLAREDTLVARRQKAAQWVKDLAPRIPKLVVTVTPRDAQDVVVKIDDIDVTDQAGLGVSVDLGAHDIVVTSSSYPSASRHVEVDKEATTTKVQMAVAVGTTTTVTTVPTVVAVVSTTRKHAGYAFLGASGLVFASGVWATLSARSSWQDAQAACGGATCATIEQTTRANDLADRARTRARIADIAYGTSALCVALGVYFLATATSVPGHVSVEATSSSAGVTWSGRF